MVDILTTKNLTLEDQVRELQESVDNLVSVSSFHRYISYLFFPFIQSSKESLCEMDKGKADPSVKYLFVDDYFQ